MMINTNSSQVSKFNQLATALSYSNRTVKASVVLHGDDGMYWVTTMALAARLEKLGYEVVK